MAQVAGAAEVDKSFLLDKENGKLNKDPVHNEAIKVVSSAKESDKGDGINASNANIPTDAVDEWPAAKQIHSFYFVRYRLYDDPVIKAKIDQADKELQKWNRTRFKITDELKAQRLDRAELLSQVRALNVDFDQFKEILGEKKKEIEPLQQALGKLRTNNYAFGGLFSSEEELNGVIHCLQYRIQHESIPLAEEKQLLREIKRLEGTRETVLANAAMRTKIQDSMGQKEAIQDQVKLMGVDLNRVRKEQHAVQSKKKLIKDKLNAIEKRINILQEELKDVTEKRDKAYETIQELRKQRDEENMYFFQSRSLLNKAKIVAAKKDMKALEELAAVEAEKFMALWNGDKAFRDDYEKRILTSLDSRQLSRDGRIRNPDEKPLVAAEVPVPTQTETILRPSSRQPKEEAKSAPQPGTKKKVQKEAETKVMESKSSPENVEREKKARKKAAAASSSAVNPEEPTEPEAEAETEASESEKVGVNADAPVPAPVSVKDKAKKENTVRYRNRTKGPEALPRAILRRKKSTNYWTWAAPAALAVLILLALNYYYYLV
ncbi:Proton pump-interactor 1 [Hibiscus syriacus]|uniref:Proton pump-interactor 1 n=1 Tax=Hibiscus syriacus TaxID=106335 RepID=A0A6A3CRB5_HIBSY|nr:Proton pump-interactor 1 [Hibiscus syriacus]